MNNVYCTTFSKLGYEKYGREFIKTFLTYSNCNLILVLEDVIDDLINHPRIKVVNNKFHEIITDSYKDLAINNDYRYQPKRFSYKTSCVKIAYDDAEENNHDFLIWIDADSKIKDASFDDVMISLLPNEEQIVSFFDRDSSYGYSETGIVCFNLRNKRTKEFIFEWNDIMVSGKILKYSEWHDAFLFSHLVRKSSNANFKFLCREHNLKTSHPIFEYAKTRKVIEHLKGDVRKKLGFNPERYFISMRLFSLYAKIKSLFGGNK
tara:strand:- start:4941 stop:5729 length:789 start_codon:yes stop_codon:yes gene_type:complete